MCGVGGHQWTLLERFAIEGMQGVRGSNPLTCKDRVLITGVFHQQVDLKMYPSHDCKSRRRELNRSAPHPPCITTGAESSTGAASRTGVPGSRLGFFARVGRHIVGRMRGLFSIFICSDDDDEFSESERSGGTRVTPTLRRNNHRGASDDHPLKILHATLAEEVDRDLALFVASRRFTRVSSRCRRTIRPTGGCRTRPLIDRALGSESGANYQGKNIVNDASHQDGPFRLTLGNRANVKS